MEAMRKDAKEMQSPPTWESDESLTNRVGTGSSKPCSRCLGAGHLPSECQFKSAKCNISFRTGHIAKACRSKVPTLTRRSQHNHYHKKDIDAKSHSKRKGVVIMLKMTLHSWKQRPLMKILQLTYFMFISCHRPFLKAIKCQLNWMAST